MSINLEKNCINELLKDDPTQKKNIEPIYRYLQTLKLLVHLLKSQSPSNYENTLQELSKIIKLRKICKNELIIQQGEIGENFFILLNGHLKILTLRPYEYYMSEEEYFLFLLQSRIYNQTDIIQQCNHFNSLVYPIPYENFDAFVKDISDKEATTGMNLDNPKIIKKAIEVNEIITKEKDNIENKNKTKIIISPEGYIKKNKVSEKIIYNTQLINNFINSNNTEENCEEDINKIKLIMKDRKKVIIPEYEIFYEIETGSFFGDTSLESSSCLQEYTIISVQDESHLAYISKKEYNSLIHNTIDKRNTNIFNIILYFSLYRPINQVLFEKKYLHFFIDKVYDINNVIFNEGDESGVMYFITDGEYELSVNKNILEVNEMIIKYKETLQKINKNNKISNSYLNTKEEIKQNNSLIVNQKFNTIAANKLILDKKYIKLSVLYAKDIIGLSDVFLYNNENENYSKDNENSSYNKPTVIFGEQVSKKCLVSCKCLTYNCHTYSLNNIIFNNLYYNEGNYNQTTKNLEIKKICSIIERLQKHKQYIFDLVNQEQNKFSKKIKKLKFFTKNPKIRQKVKLEPSLYHNILADIKLSMDSKDKYYNSKLYKRNNNKILNNETIFNTRHVKSKDKFDFTRQYFPTITKNKKSNMINKYSLNLKLMKKQKENAKEKNETIFTIYNKNSSDVSQNNLSKLLIRDFIYEKYFYNYTFNNLNDNNNNYNYNYDSQKNIMEDKTLEENNKAINTNFQTEENFQKNTFKSFSCDKTKKFINIKKKNNFFDDTINKNNSLCRTNLDIDSNNTEVFKSNYSNFSIDGRIFEKYNQNQKKMKTVPRLGKNKIRLMKIKPGKIYDPLAFDKFNNFFNFNFRKQYIMVDNN